MRIVVTGATGNVGTSVLKALAADSKISSVAAVARRIPDPSALMGAEFIQADVSCTDLEPIFRGADAVIHLAWLIQPGRDEQTTRRVNVEGSRRVFDAVVRSGVPTLVYASSVGAYSAGPKDRRVDEAWPTEGTPTSFYSRHKAEVERLLDDLERDHPLLRVVRLRPGLIFKREAASEIRRLFIGPFPPRWVFDRRLVPLIPDVPRLAFQSVHADDVGEAYRLAAVGSARGAFNIAAEPVIDVQRIAEMVGARPVKAPAGLMRGAAAAAFKLRLSPTEPGWLDMALAVPLMSTERAERDLGFVVRRSSEEALRELCAGLRDGAGGPTPTLKTHAGGPVRVREFLTGLGSRQ
jgi:nucleoside-diphosphate-sugar epimerase